MRDFFSNRYVRMLGAYVGIGVAAVIAYSPGLMALSPMDPSILRAGASLIAGVLMCAGLGVSTHMAMRDERRYVPLGTGAQSVDPQVVTRPWRRTRRMRCSGRSRGEGWVRSVTARRR